MNLAQLRTEVLNRGFDPTVFSSRIVTYLNDAQNEIARRVNYYGDEALQPIPTVAGTTMYAFPADFARARELVDIDRHTPLEYVGLRDIDRSPTTVGIPNFYAIDGPNIHLYPTPDGLHNLILRYWKMPAQLVNDGDVPSIPNDWHNLLWVYATFICYESEDDAAMGKYWSDRWEMELRKFTADQRFPDSDGPHVVKGMWDADRGLNAGGGWSIYSEW